ncbi:hypothetical protein B1R38_02635 [Bacillus cereus]|nr:hypothetical protein B1R38_02635 [Bacillus cereus]
MFRSFTIIFIPLQNISAQLQNISAQLQIYRRFSKYIGATPNISAIFEIYRLIDKNRHNIHT